MKLLSDVERLGTYNRGDKLRTIGVEEIGNRMESKKESIRKVMNIAKTPETGIDEKKS